jgi:hypothetical protein
LKTKQSLEELMNNGIKFVKTILNNISVNAKKYIPVQKVYSSIDISKIRHRHSILNLF